MKGDCRHTAAAAEAPFPAAVALAATVVEPTLAAALAAAVA